LLPLNSGPLYHYVVVRRDLPLGTILAQTIHAAGESGPAVTGTYAVALQIPDEKSLLELSQALTAAGFPHTLIREPDRPHNNAAMAIGLPPQSRDPLRPLLGKLALFK
jgi:peptidyl-tRNA hydrolase